MIEIRVLLEVDGELEDEVKSFSRDTRAIFKNAESVMKRDEFMKTDFSFRISGKESRRVSELIFTVESESPVEAEELFDEFLKSVGFEFYEEYETFGSIRTSSRTLSIPEDI